MEFALTEEHVMIRDSAERFLAQASDSHAVRAAMIHPHAHDPDVWRQIGQELYWPALMVPERCGGMGLGFVELVVLLEQCGRYLLGSPLFATACLATPALLLAHNDAVKGRWLEAIASGKTRATLAFASVPGLDACAVQTVAEQNSLGWNLNGQYAQVIDGASADLLVVAARAPGTRGEQGISLFALPGDAPGVTRAPLPTMDQTRRLARVDLHNVQVNDAHLLCGPEQGWAVLRDTLLIATIGLAAEQTGGAQQVLGMTLSYIAERRQFNRTIASFQAIKHRCADMMLRVECARSAAYYAACVAQERLDPAGDATVAQELELAAATAKIHASEAFYHCAAESIQLHGGVGFTWEYDPHLYFKRARASEQLLGSPALHRERLAAHLLGEQS